MTRPYGIPYTVRGWGDEIVTTVALDPDVLETLPEGYTAVVRGLPPGPVILVPTSALTPVDTTPPEPEPGAWDLNGVLCVRWDGDDCEDADYPWCSPLHSFTTFRAIWNRYGGSGITPRRLVPAPEAPKVDLPFTTKCGEIEVTRHRQLRVFNSICMMTSPELEQTGLALLSAARAAREATP